ncbi:MAG: glycosyltransferase [Candidatus Micrarchaeia archaeon]
MGYSQNEDYSDLTVIVPTLNEEGNIKKLIAELSRRYKNINIYVADDGSKDNTKREVEELRKNNKRIVFIDRKNEKVHGLTASVVDATKRVTTKYILVMDADLQHPVSKVKDIYDKLAYFDLVVGTRNGIKSWSIRRRIISSGITAISRTIFLIRRKKICKDMMSGFFGIRTQIFKNIIKRNPDGFVGEGFKVLLDILRMADQNIRIGEVYYSTFAERKIGKSKMSTKHMVYTIKSICR